MIDLMTHLAWIAVVALAWTWAIAQGRYAAREAVWWPIPWRAKVTIWLAAKALLLSALAVWAWDDMTMRPYEWAVWLFALIHAWVFAAWVRLPDGNPPAVPDHPPQAGHRT